MAGGKNMRLPALRYLRVRDAKKKDENPCKNAMQTVLACWASAGYNAPGCAAIENTLRACMDGPKPQTTTRNRINNNLNRMKKNVTTPTKISGPRD